ncbi:nucleoside transporter C-terminal domain-containing protein [Paenibacillus larvae]|uniref:Nucleoside transporter C-terminal domain-containing protein n=2 Tax=Paenibacillus larvae TaxID=1464 RepID=A0AAP5N241_9BACL|nr:nucleoside transporter C-terminal domain-containing protein [Paenibacillus larvae]AQR79260.1 pyrimidine nucleoside transporter NupC [Paenibacillus larvae subsp. larvae]AVF23581.1 pyrimidine nucleoside transport protein NupC [Paenibacillus larvae subsp. larvae]ETK29752.1 pyrimidine nucleoside transport protein NupC [Paenibacillus larvae subsp. larvae DSM 25719]MCY7476485.1 NupC/NupG family nucleoside CNT transporter [Paenibacillus larvae]MCY7488800.1 NupC/NupG family nucleoside CNT transport
MNVLFAIAGLLLVFVLGYMVSYNRKGIRFKPIVLMLITQLILSFIMLNTEIGVVVIGFVSKLFSELMDFGIGGVEFVFGGLQNEGASTFFLNVLLPIIFISILIGILNFFKILPLIIKYVGLALSKLNGMGKLENYIAISSAFLGQSEVFLTAKKQLGLISKRRLYTLCTSAMSAVSIAIVGAYMTMLEPKYVVVAIILNIFSALIIANIVNPYELKDEDDLYLEEEDTHKMGFFQMISESIMDGFKVAIIVGAMLMGFIALMNMIDYIFNYTFGVSFQSILGYIFAPIAFVMGIPWSEAVQAGSIMATKLVTNEFVAMMSFQNVASGFSAKTMGMVSVFLVSFANFSSVGIITGSVKALNEKQGNHVANFGMKLLFGSTLASILSATIIGLFL